MFIHMLAQYEYVKHPNKMYSNSKNWFSSLIPFRYWSCFILLWSLSLFLLILKYLIMMGPNFRMCVNKSNKSKD